MSSTPISTALPADLELDSAQDYLLTCWYGDWAIYRVKLGANVVRMGRTVITLDEPLDEDDDACTEDDE